MPDQRFTTVLWRGKWLIVASLAVAVGLAILITSRSARVYESSATIQVNSANSIGQNGSSPADIQAGNQVLAQTYATLIDDRSFIAQIRDRVAGGQLSTAEIESRISSSWVQNTALIKLAAEGPSPETARTLAADVAREFVRTVRSDAVKQTGNLRAQIQGQISQIERAISKLPRGSDRSSSLKAARSELVRQLAALIAGSIAQGNSVALTAPPSGSSAPVKPRPALNLMAGILLGLLVGVALAFLRDRLDRGLHSSEEAEELLGVPLLASIPVRKRFSVEDPVLGEAYNVLRANLAFLSLENSLQVLTFSSFNPREGKSSTVEGLGHAGVRAGLNVLLIDGDVRTRTLSARLGYEEAPGLTTVVVGLASLDDVIVELAPGLSLLPSGPIPPNPPSLLSSAHVRDLMASLREQYGLIVIDSPPVAHLADASILASVSDGVVVVARQRVTKREDLTAAAANLRQVPTPLVGFVLLEQKTIDQTYYPAMASPAAPAAPASVADAAETF